MKMVRRTGRCCKMCGRGLETESENLGQDDLLAGRPRQLYCAAKHFEGKRGLSSLTTGRPTTSTASWKLGRMELTPRESAIGECQRRAPRPDRAASCDQRHIKIATAQLRCQIGSILRKTVCSQSRMALVGPTWR